MQCRIGDVDGLPAKSYTHERHVARNHFTELLDGDLASLQQILILEHSEWVERAQRHRHIVRSVDQIPSMKQITIAHAHLNGSKGHGAANVGPEVHKCLPLAMALLTHPLHVKAVVYIERPLQWRGGQLLEL